MYIKKFTGMLLILCMMHPAFADDIAVQGTIPINVPTTHPMRQPAAKTKETLSIALMKLSLSSEAKQALHERVVRQAQDHLTLDSASSLPRRVQLGMNGVPPLNQGSHGTCVTFAVTAAVDAILGKGDYISQLCQLELGNYLEHNSYTSSGWDGSWGRIILSQMDVFGFTPKSSQLANLCGSIQEYPLTGEDPTAELSLTDFHAISSSLAANQVAWSSMLEVYQLSSEDIDANHLLREVKQTLNAGDRLTFGVLLVDFNQGVAGAVGTYHQPYDTWILTPKIIEDIENQPEFAGHEMIITGYDDDAVAVDAEGRQYKGLLTVRNSWGANVGDGGNFYISYDFFKHLTIEVQRIRHLG